MNRTFIRRHITSFSIVLYLLLFAFFIGIKPSFLYNNDGSLRHFGVGYRSKTVIPIWLLAITTGIFSYFIILYYLAMPQLTF